jgi:hypothetical protein
MDKDKQRPKIHRYQIQGSDPFRDKQDDKVMPDHTKSAFLEFDNNTYVIHRIGPGKEYEQLRGPYRDKQMAYSKLAEMVEHFVRDHAVYSPRVIVRKPEFAKITVSGMCAKGEGPKKVEFYYVVKPLLY